MACGGCGRRKKAFSHRVKKNKKKALKETSINKIDTAKKSPKFPPAELPQTKPVSSSKKKKRNVNKRALWIRKKRREARQLKKDNKKKD